MKKSIIIDLGTNSIIFTSFTYKNNILFIEQEANYTTRIGKNLLKTGLIKQEAIKKNIDCINLEINKLKQFFEIDKIYALTTQALRKAENNREVIKKIKEQTNIEFEIISESQEALLTFKAVEHLINNKLNIVSDIGGGSSEFIVGNNKNITSINSLPFGAVFIEEKYNVSTEKPKKIEQAKNDINKQINFLPSKINQLILCGGTATTIASILKKQNIYNANEIEGLIINSSDLTNINIQDTCKIDDKRLDIIRAGIAITETLIQQSNPDIIKISTLGVRHGYLKEILNYKCIQYC